MLTFIKNIIISVFLGFTTYIVLGLLRNDLIQIPANKSEYSEVIVICIAIFISTFFVSKTREACLEEENDYRETGTVKWFNVKKGYGFITRDQGDDIFVHYKNIEGSGRRFISEGERVSFVVIDGDKGLQADEVITV
ncbi:MAG: cold-shock protein [Candidatus Azotimanducaceae bacterium]|uniref:Cold shock domain-containing protein n=1 Tax=OM182 bacterium TaxID=2510334 RepID=A0A520S184_9GAMM|nr:hypothetical protein [Gammaproteobacteria bacterium]OUV68795.1 MAG: hypothetical protein CBC93_00240 [Gammaproteobacteria bacterium TMED133]RZO76232.1 MAG: cold shock domain-containing protein [OM182 bacterium]